MQHTVRDHGRFVARVDLWFPGLAPEADGFEFHSGRADYRRDRLRWRRLTRAGVLCLPFSWEDVHLHPGTAVDDVAETLAWLAARSDVSTLARNLDRRRAS